MTKKMIDGHLVDLTAEEQAEFDMHAAAGLPPIVPYQVPMRSFRLALYQGDLLTSAENFIAGIPDEAGDLARIDWATSPTVRRDGAVAAYLISNLSKTRVEVDALFVTAAAIPAG